MESRILEELFDNKILQILKLFFREKEKTFYLREITKLSNVPLATTYRIVNKLVHLQLIEIISIRKFKLYRLANNQKTQFLDSFLHEGKKLIQFFIDEITKIPEIEAVILHGKETEDKANMLVIGENIDPNAVKRVCGVVREQYSFTISTLTLTKEQFAQMSSMGLYSGKKKVLYSKESAENSI
jgi:Fe2+ or Zn2+ uptake regulation protein